MTSLGTRFERCTGRDHVINKQDILAGQHSTRDEGTANIFRPLVRIEIYLWRSLAPAHQRSVMRYSGVFAQFNGDSLGLIESALLEATAVQRHRYQY
jgi:hypothetical protein